MPTNGEGSGHLFNHGRGFLRGYPVLDVQKRWTLQETPSTCLERSPHVT